MVIDSDEPFDTIVAQLLSKFNTMIKVPQKKPKWPWFGVRWSIPRAHPKPTLFYAEEHWVTILKKASEKCEKTVLTIEVKLLDKKKKVSQGFVSLQVQHANNLLSQGDDDSDDSDNPDPVSSSEDEVLKTNRKKLCLIHARFDVSLTSFQRPAKQGGGSHPSRS